MRALSGVTSNPEYFVWRDMLRRCEDKRRRDFSHYGGRGIMVCPRWHSFKKFFSDMGKRPLNYTLERKDNDKGYCPANCKWVTRAEQNTNQRCRKDNKLGIKGVRWHNKAKRYQVRINVNKKAVSVGFFDKISDAIAARKKAELQYWGK